MSEKQSHTPTPWVATEKHIHTIHGPGSGYNVGTLISEEDAAFIVKAVNCHEELVKCLDEAYRYLERDSKYVADVLQDRILQILSEVKI